MNWSTAGVMFIGVFAATLVATRAVLAVLSRRAILDLPNERSSHTVPTPKGGGIAVVAVLIPVWYAAQGTPEAGILCAAAAALATLSWIDDLAELQPAWRLLGQAAAVGVVLLAAPPGAPVFGGYLPDALDTLAAALLWLWFINLYNFMDGIDGLAATETATIGAGAAAVALVAGLGWVPAVQGLTAAAAGLGFLWWNRPPARIFLGDVGSVTLGFLLGWLLLELARRGQAAAALILPLYFLADATFTLLRRAARLAPVWRAHHEHLYQCAIEAGATHGTVVSQVLIVNLGLIALATLAAEGLPGWALIGAFPLAGLLLWRLGRARRPPS